MALATASIFGTPNVGVYAVANDEIALVPTNAPEKFTKLIIEILNVEDIVKCSIGGLSIIGVLAVMNNHGILLPKIVLDYELDLIKKTLKSSLEVAIVQDTKYTALGNLILANNHAALTYTHLEGNVLKTIEDVLDVEVMRGDISDEITLVGSAGVINDYGLLLHPSASESKIRELMEFFKVSQADVGTINRGVPFLRTGIVTNNKGAIVGEESTGPELMHIGRVLGVS